ncbi:hypothetical protein [Sulfurovum sp.]|uniref:hypothetical protein n=1 Tax=Sulfurovum sp. TaxID=1969726 RepID=UPI0025EFC684|nr:hypothetical protein [Sulfurovum sp.]
MKVSKQFSGKRIIGVMAILLFGIVSQANAQQTYTKYCNARYGFCVEYPVTFGMEPAPTNNDGRVFYDRDGYSMRVYGSYNALEHSLNDEMKDEEKGFDLITYRTKKNNWYVLSGYKDDEIIYLKTYMSRDKEIFYHLYISYPAKFKTDYNKIVSKASRSFKPGS